MYRRLGVRRAAADDAAVLYACVQRLGLCPEVLGVLAELDPRYRLGIVSNADNDDPMLDIARALIRFAVTVTSEEAQCYKPAPGIYRLACMRLGCPPGRCVYVGDRPWEDVYGANAAGCTLPGSTGSIARIPRACHARPLRLTT